MLKDEQAVVRLIDAANIGKHGGKLDPDRKGYSTAEIINQSITAVPVMGAAWYEGPFGDPPDEAKNVVVAPQTELVMRTKSMQADGTRHFQLDDADAAIAAWEKFLANRGAMTSLTDARAHSFPNWAPPDTTARTPSSRGWTLIALPDDDHPVAAARRGERAGRLAPMVRASPAGGRVPVRVVGAGGGDG